MLRKKKLVTRLNGESPLYLYHFTGPIRQHVAWVFWKTTNHAYRVLRTSSKSESSPDELQPNPEQDGVEGFSAGQPVNLIKDNPVSNRIQPRKQPGLYMIRCLVNDLRYYGESGNVSGRLASHKSMLRRSIHPNTRLQRDWRVFGEDNFDFVVLFMGQQWEDRQERRAKETLLIIGDRQFCYNYLEDVNHRPGTANPFFGRKHSEETKEKIGASLRGIPNDALGKAIQFEGVIYASLAAASRATGCARKTLRKRLNDPNDLTCVAIHNEVMNVNVNAQDNDDT